MTLTEATARARLWCCVYLPHGNRKWTEFLYLGCGALPLCFSFLLLLTVSGLYLVNYLFTPLRITQTSNLIKLLVNTNFNCGKNDILFSTRVCLVRQRLGNAVSRIKLAELVFVLEQSYVGEREWQRKYLVI